LNFSLLDKIPIQQLFSDYYIQNSENETSNQLIFNL
jgi:hypothetical protein